MAKLAVLKTTQNELSIEHFLNSIENEQKRKDSQAIIKMMEKATKEKPKMWGASIIGFGKLRIKSPTSGREVEWFRIGFSPRKTNLSINFVSLKPHAAAMEKLGKYKAGMVCLYINKLEDVEYKSFRKDDQRNCKMICNRIVTAVLVEENQQ